MLNLEISCVNGCALVSASGSLSSADDGETVAAAMTFVPPDDHLVVDLRGIVRVDPDGARTLSAAVLERVACAAEVVVVTDQPNVSMHLILNDVDRAVPMVASLAQALQVIKVRSGYDSMEVL